MEIPSEKAKEGGGQDVQLDVNVVVPSHEGHRETDHQNVEEGNREENDAAPFQFNDSIRPGGGLEWSLQVNRTLSKGISSRSKDISLLEAKSFGKILVIGGTLQSAENDEFIYHECLVHPALLFHHKPRSVFIMGGAEGSAAREVLKHKSVKEVFMCSKDKELVNFCRTHLTKNQDAFRSDKLHLVFGDAKDELEKTQESFDVIVGDLEGPLEESSSLVKYNKHFYKNILKPKLNPMGIFVTQAGPAGVLTHKTGFTSIYNTLRCSFQYIRPFYAHVPSYGDTIGWVMASEYISDLQREFHPLNVDMFDNRISERIEGGELRYLNGATIMASSIFNKIVHSGMENETDMPTEE